MNGPGKVWAASTGMHQLLYAELDELRRSGFRSRNGTLEVILRPGISARVLERVVRSASGGRGRGYWLVRGTSLGVGFAIGGLTLLGLALIDLFSQLVGTVITDRLVSNRWHGWLLVSTFLLGGAAVSFAPRLLSTDGGWARTLVMRWVDGESRALVRINRRLRSAAKHGVLRRVVVWNAFAPDSIGASGIIECFRGVPVTIELRIHHDEQTNLADFWTLLRREPDEVRIVETNALDDMGRIGADPLRMLEEIAGNGAAWAFGTAMQHSSFGAIGAWKRAIENSGAYATAGIAFRLAAARVDQDSELTVSVSDAVRGDTWMTRFILDYRLLTPELIPGVLRTTESISDGDPLVLHREIASALETRHPAHARLPGELESDVASVFATLLRTPEAAWESSEFGRLLNSYVQLAAAHEHYRGVQVLAQLIALEFERPSDERRLLATLTISSLTTIQEPLSVAGHGQLAIRIARWIAPFTGSVGAIQRARLLERIGSYDAAYAELELLDISGNVAMELAEEYLQVRTWVLLSAGRHEQGWGPDVVRDHLERLDEIYAHHARVRTPELARMRENYWALLHEWEGNRKAALECHQRAIELPGLPLRRVLGQMINKGRCLRDLALVNILESSSTGMPELKDEWDDALVTLAEAGEIVERGYQGKLTIGDTDEAPIGAHNLALVQLYQSAIALRIGRDSQEFARSALTTAREGLAILASTESTRKKSTLVAEAKLALTLLNEDGSSELENLLEALPKADQKNLEWVLILAGTHSLGQDPLD